MLQKLADQLGGKVNENICKDLEDLEDPVQVFIKSQTVKRYMTALRAVLRLAYEDGILEENPSTWALKYPKFFYTPIECLDPDDYACIINNLKFKAENSSLELIDIIVAIGLLAGLRRGEIVALRWKDFRDLGNKPNNEILLSVTKSAYKPKGSEQIIKDVKTTDSVRCFVIEEILAEVLVSWRNKLVELGVPAGDNNHVVCNKHGNMVSVYSPTKWFGEYLEEHNFRHVKLHSLRHTFASILIYAGLDIDTVKSLMGHEDISTTQIYFHEFSMKKGVYISKINKFNTKLLKIKEEI